MPPSLIPWTADLETGHPEIDAQHKTILKALNRLQAAMESQDGEEETGWCLSFIKAYTKVHFRTEEAMFSASPNLDVAGHLAAHQQLAASIDALFRRFLKGERDLQVPTLEILRHWVAEHIQKDDQALLRSIPVKRDRR